ncbi:hypothetical protein [Azospirillum sp. sgz301742]
MRTLSLTVAVAGSLLLLAPAAMAQQQQDQGWRGTLDQLNRAVNPDTQQQRDERRERDLDQDRDRSGQYDDRTDSRNRRLEGSSGSSSGQLRSYSDGDIRDRWNRLSDEQRQLQRERRALEDEMDRRGLRR